MTAFTLSFTTVTAVLVGYGLYTALTWFTALVAALPH